MPKTFYIYHAHDFEGEPDKQLPALFGEETIYKKANLVKGFAHEVLMQVEEKGSVLTWVSFALISVYRLAYLIPLATSSLSSKNLYMHTLVTPFEGNVFVLSVKYL